MKVLPLRFSILALFSSALIPACSVSLVRDEDAQKEERQEVVATRPVAKDVVTTQQYVCQIHSRRHIEVRALERGYLQEVNVQEGQSVKQGEVLFKIVPVLYQATLDTEMAHAEVERIRFNNTALLTRNSIVSNQELAMAKAELAKANAQVKKAQAELNFTTLRAPFDGIVDRQHEQLGSLVEEGDVLTTMSDNQVMWVYFNVPEARYLQYKADNEKDSLEIRLKLANGEIFAYPGKIGAIEADFNNETGNIAFRADFPNPDSLLRHGQTGTILIHRKLPGALVIPQRSTYEILAKKYVYVLEPETKQGAQGGSGQAAEKGDEHAAKQLEKRGAEAAKEHGIVRQREISIQEEMDDIYVIKDGLKVTDKIIFEGVRQVRDGDEAAYELEPPEKILSHLKYHAE
jgi:membrane fusion protein (multidrug efflux system)